MQAQAPVLVANVRVGRDRRQLLSELDPYSPFLYSKLFIDTDGEKVLVLALNHDRFQNC